VKETSVITSTLAGRLRALTEVGDDVPAVEFGGAWVAWGDLQRLARRASAELDALGLGEGARVGVVLENRPESIALVWLALTTSRCLTVFNPLQPMERLTADIARGAPPVLFATSRFWNDQAFTFAVVKTGAAGFVMDGPDARPAELPSVLQPATPARTAPGIAVELSTSGTTGPPKRIPLSYRQIEAALGSVNGHMAPGQRQRAPFTGGVSLVTTPMVHIGGLWGVLQGLAETRRLVLLERFTVDAWRDAVRRHRPRIAGLPPAAIRSVLDADVPAEDLESLRAITAGAAPTPPELADAFLDRYGIPVLVVYGATEFSGAVAGWSLRDHGKWWVRKRGSVGRPFPGVELRVIGEDGEPLAAGKVGVLEIRTPQAGGDGDWIRTSDLARVDDDGFLWLRGRADDVIIRGGFKVLPSTVVGALERHPAIAEAAVAGVPDQRLGQVPVAAFELAPGYDAPTDEELRAFCRKELLPYEVPVRFLPVDALPRGVSQKVSRTDLLTLFAETEGK
jgi:acyl-coenzyme A synthetase/AMP-(fatty) acid ligase